jgi:dienelactone hydrolase
VVPRLLSALLLTLLLAGCGSSSTPVRHADVFDYDDAAPLGYADNGRVNHGYPIAVHDVSFRSKGQRVEGFLLLPPGDARRPAVVFVHGSGGDREQLLAPAGWLAARGVVTLTLTQPSTAHPPAPASGVAILDQQREIVVRDVVAVRRAVDLLASLPQVDAARIGYVGWSAGAKTGTFVASSDSRVEALALLSAGADPLSAFVAHAPAEIRDDVKRALGPVDPIGAIHRARPGTLLLEDGRADRVVPRAALRNVIRAAPKGTTVRWYTAGHELAPQAYLDAFDWLAGKLKIEGPPVAGARTGP